MEIVQNMDKDSMTFLLIYIAKLPVIGCIFHAGARPGRACKNKKFFVMYNVLKILLFKQNQLNNNNNLLKKYSSPYKKLGNTNKKQNKDVWKKERVI